MHLRFFFFFLAFDMMVILSNKSVMGNPSSLAGLCHGDEQRKIGFSFLQTFFATEERCSVMMRVLITKIHNPIL